MPTRIVRPDTTKIPISNGDWLLVKTRLNHGELQDALASRYISENVLGTRVNLKRAGMEQVIAHLIDWSLVDLDDKPLVIRGQSPEVVEAALNALDPDDFDEIRLAIEAHITREAQRRADQKKAMTGSPDANPISPSPLPAGGASSGSAS